MTQPKRQTLDRLLSRMGIASRNVAAEWVRAGRVRVNGRLIRDPETWINWPADKVLLDNKPLGQTERIFLILHKPGGYVTSHSDERGRKTVYDLIPPEFGFVHAVGRLDKPTSGLLLLTNDTKMSSFLTEPINKVSRIYEVSVWGDIAEGRLRETLEGVEDEGEHLHFDGAKIVRNSKRETHLEVSLTHGKNREIRRLFEKLGHEVTRLHRIQYGPFTLDGLAAGKWKEIPIQSAEKILKIST